MAHVDKGQTVKHDQSDLMGMKPHGSIGPGRTAQESAIVNKLKKKKVSSLRAEGSTAKSGERANAGECSKAIGGLMKK